MFKKISAVRAVSATELVVWFTDGEVRLLDYQSAFGTEVPAGEVSVDAEGYGITFADGSEVGCRELYALGTPLDFVRSESKRVISEIVAARHKRGFSQARLASAAGVKQPVVARLETSANSPRLDTLLKILTPLGKTLTLTDLEDVCDLDKAIEAAEGLKPSS